MDDAHLPAEWLYRIKAATRELVRRVGTLENAHAITGYSTSAIHRWRSTSAPDIIPLPAALLLEAETGDALITAEMAAIGGRRIAAAEGDAPGAGFIAAHMRYARETADYHQTVTEAAADGVLTPNEQEAIWREAAEVADAVQDLQAELAGGKGAPITLFRRAG